jgi:hypothetical protein
VGGHLHDYADRIQLEDARTGQVLVTLETDLTRTGRLKSVDVAYFELTRGGLRLDADRPYRVVVYYNNTSGAPIPNGAMAYMAGPFAPDDASLWPALDRDDPVYRSDLQRLTWEAESQTEHAHAAHGH